MGKELLLRAYHGERTEKTPWVPYGGTHGAALIGAAADAYLQDPELLAQGVVEMARRYRADGLPLVADLQVEAMDMGCEAQWSAEEPPSITRHVLDDDGLGMEGLRWPDPSRGRWKAIAEAVPKIREGLGDDVALIGLFAGPCTLAHHLRGIKLFTDLYKDMGKAREVINIAGEANRRAAEFYIGLGVDVVAFCDPTSTMLRPELFRELVTPQVQKTLEVIHGEGKTSGFWA